MSPASSHRKIAVALVLLAPLSVQAQQTIIQPCSYSYTPNGLASPTANWDFSGLFDGTNDYTWEDDDDFYTTNSSYTFQVCGNVNKQPDGCSGRPLSPAYQVTRRNGAIASCYGLSRDLNQKPQPKYFALLDQFNPARGVAMTYTGGDAIGDCPSPRQFTLEFICDANAVFPPVGDRPPRSQYFTWVDEVNTCQYVAHSYSPYGCPVECTRVNGQVCGGTGVCGWDTSIQQARCFCNDDYIESDCQTPRTPYPTGSVAGSVIGGMLLGSLGLVGVIFFLQRRGGKHAAPAVEGFYG